MKRGLFIAVVLMSRNGAPWERLLSDEDDSGGSEGDGSDCCYVGADDGGSRS